MGQATFTFLFVLILFSTNMWHLHVHLQLRYFDDPVARCVLYFEDCLESTDVTFKFQFFTQLTSAIPLLPKVSDVISLFTSEVVNVSPVSAEDVVLERAAASG